MRSSRNPSGITVAAFVAATLAASTVGWAQSDDDGIKLEEVTVTARKIEENQMTVPMAITALTSADLEATGAKQLNDIMAMTPSFYFSNQQGASGRNDRTVNSLIFRGLYLDRNAGLTAGGQMFVDGAPVLGAMPPAMADVERVEVLKGPQSAYFGRSAFAGAISFTTRDPSEDFRSRVMVETSSYDSYEAVASIEGGLGETLTGRLSGRSFVRGGYYDNATAPGQRLGKQGTNSVSATLVWRPADSLKVKAFINGYEDNDGPPAQGAILASEFNGRPQADGSCPSFSQLAPGVAAPGQTANSRASFGYYCGTIPTLDKLPANVLSGNYDLTASATRNALFNGPPTWYTFDQSFRTKGGLAREALQSNVRVDWEFGDGYTLTSLSAYHADRYQTILDLNYRGSQTLVNPYYPSNRFPTGVTNIFTGTSCTPATCVASMQALLLSQSLLHDWSQELRVTSPADKRLRWTLGLNYFDGLSRGGTVVGILPTGANFTAAKSEQTSKTPAAFGAVYFDFTDTVTLSVEGRYQKDKIHNQALAVAPTGLPPTGLAAVPLDAEFSSFSPRVTLDWEYAPGSIVYALFSRGNRPGGFNAGYVTLPAAAIAELQARQPDGKLAYEEEELENYELGIKSTWLDGRARTTLTVYKDEWKNGQVGTTVPLAVINNLVTITTNQGLVDLDGVEFEGKFQVTREFSVGATYALNNSEIKSYGTSPGGVAGACADCNNVYGSFAGVIGRELPVVPKTTWTVNAEFEKAFRDDLSWYVRADYQHQGSKYTDFAEVAKVGARENLNARIGLRGDNWSLEAFGTNLTDDKTMVSALGGIDVFTFLVFPTKNSIRISPPIPQSFGIRATYELGGR